MTLIRYNGQEFRRKESESVLDALTRGGAVITHSCRRGTCQACLMRVVSGEVEEASRADLSEELIETAHFLPCQSHNDAPIELEDADFSFSYVEARLMAREDMGEGFWRLRFRPSAPFRWSPGQYLHLRRTHDPLTRAYCVVNQGQRTQLVEIVVTDSEAPFVQWLLHDLGLGQKVLLQGPHGGSHLREEDTGKTLTLLGEGAGLASVRAIAQDALVRGWDAPVTVHYTTHTPVPPHEREALTSLQASYPNLRVEAVDGTTPETLFAPDALRDHVVLLAGDAELLSTLRAEAIFAGAERRDVRATAFERAEDFWPPQRDPFSLFQPDPELWAALDEGEKMRTILDEFYTEVYADTLLRPFFENVTRERAVYKQWSFLADAFSGTRNYFGLKPFNAHHWMIISDELFDYREDMFQRYLDKHQVAPEHQRKWLAFQERFRREIVKHHARGLIIDGVEKEVEGFSIEQLAVGTVCDGCHAEMNPGTWGRLHLRTGQLFCEECRAVATAQTSA